MLPIQRKRLIDQPGVIACISGDRSTYPQFTRAMMQLFYPPGTRMEWRLAGGGALAYERTHIALKALNGGAAWIWFIDDDHTFHPNTLLRLLQCNVDMVQPLLCTRRPPLNVNLPKHFPVSQDTTDAQLLEMLAANSGRAAVPPGHRGLVETGYLGTGGLLIDARVLHALVPDPPERINEEPFFQFGQLGNKSAPGEDVWFVLRARRLGFKCFCDTGTPMGHLQTFEIWPKCSDDGTLGSEICFEVSAQEMEQRIEPRYADPRTTPAYLRRDGFPAHPFL